MRALYLVMLAGCSASSGTQPLAKTADPPANAIDVTASFEVTSEDCSFAVGGRTVGCTIAVPRREGRSPGVLLLAGSGPTDRDWNSPLIPTKNGSAALLATALAGRGAVVLRFDKAGSGLNPGPPLAEWTIDTYRDEAVQALALLRKRPDVRTDRVFVAGHSEGGIHATRLAAVAQPPLAGIVYLSAASRTLADTMIAQLEAQLRNPMAMLSDKAVDQEIAGIRQAFADFLAGKPVDATKASRIPQLQQFIAGILKPETATLTRALLGFDNAIEAPKLAGPFFVFAGGKDIQIDVDADTRRLDKALRAANREVTLHVSKDADHVLKHEPKSQDEIRANLLAAQNAYNAEGRVLDEDFVGALVGWLAKQTR